MSPTPTPRSSAAFWAITTPARSVASSPASTVGARLAAEVDHRDQHRLVVPGVQEPPEREARLGPVDQARPGHGPDRIAVDRGEVDPDGQLVGVLADELLLADVDGRGMKESRPCR